MSGGFNRLFNQKATTITGAAPSFAANKAAFAPTGNGVSSSAPFIGLNQRALSKSTSSVDAQLRRQAKPLPASTIRRAQASSQRTVRHGLIVGRPGGGGGGPTTTYSVEIQNRGPLDSRDARPKVSRSVPRPTPTQYTDYLPPKQSNQLHTRGGEREGGGDRSTRMAPVGSHTDRVSFSSRPPAPNQNEERQSGSRSELTSSSSSQRETSKGRWRPPTMTVTIHNENRTATHDCRQTNQGAAPLDHRPTASRRTSNPEPEQFSDYVNRRFTTKPLVERNAVPGDRTKYPRGSKAEVMQMGTRIGDRPIVRNMSTETHRNTRTDLSGGIGPGGKDMYFDEGKRPSLSDRFRNVETRQRFQGKITRGQRGRAIVRGSKQQQGGYNPRGRGSGGGAIDPKGTRTGGMLDRYSTGDDRWRPSHHVDATLVSKVKIQAMRQMRSNPSAAHEVAAAATAAQRYNEQAVRDSYAPTFSESTNKPQPIAKRMDNVRGEDWFANTTTNGCATLHKFGWDNSKKMAPHLKRSMERSSVTVINPNRRRPVTAGTGRRSDRESGRRSDRRSDRDSGYYSDEDRNVSRPREDDRLDNYSRERSTTRSSQRRSRREETYDNEDIRRRQQDVRYEDNDQCYDDDQRYNNHRDTSEYYETSSIWEKDWSTVAPHIEQIQQQYQPAQYNTTW